MKKKWTKSTNEDGSVTFRWPGGFAKTYGPSGCEFIAFGGGGRVYAERRRKLWLYRLWRLLILTLHDKEFTAGDGMNDRAQPDAPWWERVKANTKSRWQRCE